MWDMNPRKILVGVEHAGSGQAALEYAAQEAARRGCGVHLVHVARPAVSAACALDDVVLVEDELRRCGMAVLADSAARLEHLLGVQAPDDERLSVSTELSHGAVVASLVQLSAHAGLVVLEHEGMGPEGETATLSVTAGVAAGARCPVVAVPDDWRPAPPYGRVVVGVDLAHPSAPLLGAAAHEAVRRAAQLRVVHAYDEGGIEQNLRDHLCSLVDAVRTSEPGIDVDAQVRSGPAGRVLVAEAQAGDLVVVGRHHRKHVVGASLGPTSRELLRRSSGPVLVVDPVRGDAVARPARPGVETTREGAGHGIQ